MWKKEAENIKAEASKKNRRRKNSRKTSTQKVLEVEESVWKGEVKKNAYKKTVELCDRIKKRVCAEKREKVQAFMEDQL